MTADKPNILVVGSLNADFCIRTPQIPHAGESVIGHSFTRGLGGKGSNQAIAAAKLGGSVTMVGRVGNDLFGRELLAALQSEGINIEHVQQDSANTTGAAFILLEASGQNRIVSVPGANWSYSVEDLMQVKELFRQADLLMLQLEINLSVVKTAIELAGELKLPVLLNPGPAAPLPDEILKQITILTPNESEAETLTGIKIETIQQAEQAASQLIAKGVQTVIITLGEHGALVADSTDYFQVSGFPVVPVDTVGAGDTFNGALAVELCRKTSLKEAVRFANAAAAISVTRHGASASIPNRQEVVEFFNKKNL